MTNKVLVICGPTATGKTSLGISLAKELDGEIVSADSRQIYRRMDIGTGKDLPQNVKLKIKNEKLQIKIKNGQILKPYRFDKIPVWLLDAVEPDYRFSVADYVQCASRVIEDIWRRDKLPIIVGGTGFYIKGLINGIGTLGMEPDWGLRKRLSELEISELGKKFKRLDPDKWENMNESDRQNPRRLVRAIEVALQVKSSKLKVQNYSSKFPPKTDPPLAEKIGQSLWIGLKAPFKELYRRIDRRLEERVKQGVESEIERLLKKGFNWENSALGATIGYQEWKDFFGGERTKEETIQRWKFNEHRYARRQMTWFKRDSRISWFDITKQGWKKEVVLLGRRWYNLYPDDAED